MVFIIIHSIAKYYSIAIAIHSDSKDETPSMLGFSVLLYSVVPDFEGDNQKKPEEF